MYTMYTMSHHLDRCPRLCRVEAPIGRDPRERKRMAVVWAPGAGARPAASRYKVKATLANGAAALVEWKLVRLLARARWSSCLSASETYSCPPCCLGGRTQGCVCGCGGCPVCQILPPLTQLTLICLVSSSTVCCSVFHVLSQIKGPPLSLRVRAQETGRTHQIRVHAKHMGSSILGDTEYGARAEISTGGRRAFAAFGIELSPPSLGRAGGGGGTAAAGLSGGGKLISRAAADILMVRLFHLPHAIRMNQ